ncbi:hypothetical protein B0H17DRAFT_1215388 [Mycena rosella]|uniref:Uncharacterized protein n=1 Tax=Mycena rosella TaxID=1033263 RepID=A0AAD7CJK5_MYCRO|nr:hypothetical protein B0H17DRAFT_1215388 [Mycena rosella]
MFTTRFIVLVTTSIATLSLGNTLPWVNTPVRRADDTANATCVENPPLAGTFVMACLDDNYQDCDSIPVVAGGCTHMPVRQINTMSSVQVPCGWECTFYNTHNMCDPTDAVSITTLLYPGSPNLAQEAFDNVVDYVQCNPLD